MSRNRQTIGFLSEFRGILQTTAAHWSVFVKRVLLGLALLCSACGPIKVQSPIVIRHDPPAYCVAVSVHDPQGRPVAGAHVFISTLDGLTNQDGYLYLEPVPSLPPNGTNELDIYTTGYLDYKETVPIASWSCDKPVTLTPSRGPRPTRAQTLDVRANFLSMHDALGRLMFSWFYSTLTTADRNLWVDAWKKATLTHVVLDFAPCYPGFWAPCGDFRAAPGTLVQSASELLDRGLIPIVMMTTGDAGTWSEIDSNWPSYVNAMRASEPCLIGESGDPCGILVPGFEIGGPCSAWPASSISHAFTTLHQLAPAALIGYEGCPERFSGSSNPVQPDDPWQGAEAKFWTSNGGEFVSIFLYETPHGPTLLDPSGASGPFCHAGSPCGAWEDRWTEGLQRLCTGGLGWRQVPCSFFEVTGSDYKGGGVSDATVQRINDRALRLCQQYGATCTWGNGLPDSLR